MRKRVLWSLLVFLCAAVPVRGFQNRDFGVGIEVGDPTAFTAKYWLSRTHAVDVALGVFGDFSLHGDYLWHGWKVFPQPREGRLGGYVGLGAIFKDTGKDNVFGVRTVGGAAYSLGPYPVEFFLELAPSIHLSPDVDGDLDGGIGVRVYLDTPSGK